MKATFIIAALLAAAPVFAAIQDSHQHHNARGHHIPKSISKAHKPSRRAAAKRARCAAQASQSSSSLLSASSTVSVASTLSTASTHSEAAKTTTKPVVNVEVDTPTTTYQPPPSTKKAPPPATTTKDSGSSGTSGGNGPVQTGDGTFYSTGLNACGTTDQDTDFIAAASAALFDSLNVDGDSNDNPICQKKVTATYQGNSVTVRITDRCEGCSIWGSLDFSPAAFNVLADPNVGRIHGMTWVWDETPPTKRAAST